MRSTPSSPQPGLSTEHYFVSGTWLRTADSIGTSAADAPEPPIGIGIASSGEPDRAGDIARATGHHGSVFPSDAHDVLTLGLVVKEGDHLLNIGSSGGASVSTPSGRESLHAVDSTGLALCGVRCNRQLEGTHWPKTRTGPNTGVGAAFLCSACLRRTPGHRLRGIYRSQLGETHDRLMLKLQPDYRLYQAKWIAHGMRHWLRTGVPPWTPHSVSLTRSADGQWHYSVGDRLRTRYRTGVLDLAPQATPEQAQEAVLREAAKSSRRISRIEWQESRNTPNSALKDGPRSWHGRLL